MRNRQDYNRYHRSYQLERYHRLRQEAIEQLGGRCAYCGSVDNLEIDHIDPSTKSFPVGKLWGCNEELRQEELAKCQLLCGDCHLKKTVQEISSKAKPLSEMHGTATGYDKYKCRCEDCRQYKRSSRK